MKFELRTLSSLEKVFPDEELTAPVTSGMTALRGEVASFQVACRCEHSYLAAEIGIGGSFPGRIQVREVACVPCEMPVLNGDQHVLRNSPGYYPDLLSTLEHNRLRLPANQWRAVWVTLNVPEDCAAGTYDVNLSFTLMSSTDFHHYDQVEHAGFQVTVLAAGLAAQRLIHTEWFYADCIAQYYQTPCWSEQHWKLLERYIASAAEHRINMLYVPLWTPPLDTGVGLERPTSQLLEIEKSGDNYNFDFTRLERYLELGRRCGMKYFEFSHAFTQWGAAATPKVIVREDGADKKLFGWHVPADSPEYAGFLRQLLPQLVTLIRRLGLENNCFFHVSDEPKLVHLENYRAGAEIFKKYLDGLPVIDALSNFELYASGVVTWPIPANDHIDDFAGRVPQLWTYYCVSQYKDVPNRFYNMPSARNRIMGIMLYLYDVTGFLHWGFNFWYTQYSRKQNINPFLTTDAGRGYPGGDAYLVYPGEDGPLDSIRYEVLREAIQDLLALRALEQQLGRPAVEAIIHEHLDFRITMKHYPRDAAWILDLRERVNRRLASGAEARSLKSGHSSRRQPELMVCK